MDFPKITRPPRHIIEALKDIGTATVAGTLGHSAAIAIRIWLARSASSAASPSSVRR